jgi:Na+/H+ antiporter NhaD/arsenite permease-like protein
LGKGRGKLKYVVLRLLERERGLFAGAVVVAAACAALGVPFDFVLFGLTLAGVALFHHHTLQVALVGLAVILLYKLGFTGFKTGPGFGGLALHLAHEWVILANLLGLLLGFALLSNHFEESKVPAVLPRFLPDDWKGGLVLLVMIFVLSSFLDNIAAALIGGTIAAAVFRRKVHIGYLAAIVAASNAGGSGSVVGDTTTTMMWIDGVAPVDVLEAFVAAGVAVLIFGVPASLQQQRYSPIAADPAPGMHVDWARVIIVAFILVSAIVVNVIINVKFSAVSDRFPFIGAAVWLAILLAALWRRPAWALLPSALKGSIFLLSLILCASLMPVEKLPAASWQTAFGLGFVSAVFDNIPLTALALKQGGYDWGYLAYTVGFGGSMIWFGSSAGVALSNMYPQAKSVGLWLRHGWHVALAYVIGFFVMLGVLGWHPNPPHKPASLAARNAVAASPVIESRTFPTRVDEETAPRIRIRGADPALHAPKVRGEDK